MVKGPDVAEIVSAIEDVVDGKPDRQAIRQHARQFSWDETTAQQIDVFESRALEQTCGT
jgi:glycosyltransferase involved in cell wall biosynthesis